MFGSIGNLELSGLGVAPLDPSNLLFIVEDEGPDNNGRDSAAEKLTEEKIKLAFVKSFTAIATGKKQVGFSSQVISSDFLDEIGTLSC